ncbi:MAG TPA: glutathione S-transferase family protein [Rhodocyclaceae bacterium]|nr:glutathione S-transferase family protein [Rhodocyclaceae bacterium]
MIELHQFPPAFGLPNASPFCLKLETYLRMVDLPYRNRYNGNVKRAPKGKLPYIEDDGKSLADSGMIVDYLKSAYGDPLDRDLSTASRARGHAIRRLLEESLYWPLLYSRWVDEAGWALTRPAFFDALPLPLRKIVPRIVRAALREELLGQGMGRHTPDEIYRLGCADIDALAGLLGEQAYFLGDAPTSVDASAYAFFANILWTPLDSPLALCARQHPNLPAYCERMRARYWADD